MQKVFNGIMKDNNYTCYVRLDDAEKIFLAFEVLLNEINNSFGISVKFIFLRNFQSHFFLEISNLIFFWEISNFFFFFFLVSNVL